MAHATMMRKGIPVRKTEESHPQAPGSLLGAVFGWVFFVTATPASSDGGFWSAAAGQDASPPRWVSGERLTVMQSDPLAQ